MADRRPNETTEINSPLTGQLSIVNTDYSGLLLKGRYLIEREIGRGGVGIIYLALDQHLMDKPVVVKILHYHLQDSPNLEYFQKKFLEEIKALARIDHPGVVGVLDTGELPNGKIYFVMQYVEGGSLRAAIREGGMDLGRAAGIISQIGQALSAAHQSGVYHRDLKPENIMLRPITGGSELVCLIDFGMATVKDSQSAATTELTKVAGTLPYMAPEQLRGHPSASSDVFALGVIAYEMVTGRLPFRAETHVEQYELLRSGEVVLPCLLREALSIEAQTAILRALAFNPDERPSNARVFAEELAASLRIPRNRGRGDAATRPLSRSEVESNRTGPAATDGPLDLLRTVGISDRTTGEFSTQIEKSRIWPARRIAIASISAAALAIAAFVILWLLPDKQKIPPQETTTGTRSASDNSALSLNYALEVQRYRNGRPYKPPMTLSGREMFVLEAGDHVRFMVDSAQDGYLYLINEGPRRAGAAPDYNLLFPIPLINDGAALVKAGQTLLAPRAEKPGYVLDTQAGAERVWIVWAAQSVAEIENVRPRLKDSIVIADRNDVQAVERFLASQPVARPEDVTDASSKQARLTGAEKILVTVVSFEHQ